MDLNISMSESLTLFSNEYALVAYTLLILTLCVVIRYFVHLIWSEIEFRRKKQEFGSLDSTTDGTIKTLDRQNNKDT